MLWLSFIWITVPHWMMYSLPNNAAILISYSPLRAQHYDADQIGAINKRFIMPTERKPPRSNEPAKDAPRDGQNNGQTSKRKAKEKIPYIPYRGPDHFR